LDLDLTNIDLGKRERDRNSGLVKWGIQTPKEIAEMNQQISDLYSSWIKDVKEDIESKKPELRRAKKFFMAELEYLQNLGFEGFKDLWLSARAPDFSRTCLVEP